MRDLDRRKNVLGMHIGKKNEKIFLSQAHYIEKVLKGFKMENWCNPTKAYGNKYSAVAAER